MMAEVRKAVPAPAAAGGGRRGGPGGPWRSGRAVRTVFARQDLTPDAKLPSACRS